MSNTARIELYRQLEPGDLVVLRMGNPYFVYSVNVYATSAWDDYEVEMYIKTFGKKKDLEKVIKNAASAIVYLQEVIRL